MAIFSLAVGNAKKKKMFKLLWLIARNGECFQSSHFGSVSVTAKALNLQLEQLENTHQVMIII